METRVTPLVVALLTATIFASPVKAQMRGPGPGVTVPSKVGNFPSPRGMVIVSRRPHHERRFVSGRGRNPWWYPYFYNPYFPPDEYFEPVPIKETTPPVVVSQAPTLPVSTPEPLLIEWNGDHWERVTNFNQLPATAPGGTNESRSRSGVTKRNQATIASQVSLPAVLVFRDGHEEEVSSYTIMGAVMYTNTNYWTDGSWTKKIQIAALDVPATLKLNQERGVKFDLPSGPHEIVIRP
jgi:hypothetical protein